MAAYTGFRRFAYFFYKGITKKRIYQSRPYNPGLPKDLSPELINLVCLENFGERALSYANQHLSGWKPSGAYRILIKTQKGNEIKIIYKDADYAFNQIPAIVGLPFHPGPPEFAVYRKPVGALAPFLPEVYLAEEVIPGSKYRYLLQDLSQDFHRIHKPAEILQFSFHMLRLHQALNEWHTEIKPQGFLQYGYGFSKMLLEYARVNLENYSYHNETCELKSILECWPQLTKAYKDQFAELYESQPLWPIHGDTNFTNIHIHNRDPFQFKVVDWEWAGYGLPQADLAYILKGSQDGIGNQALNNFIGLPARPNPYINQELSFADNKRLYLWCQLERGLLDASIFTVQHLKTNNVAEFNLPGAINHSLAQVLEIYRMMSEKS